MLALPLIEDHFLSGIERAKTVLSVYGFMNSNAPPALDCDDLLRSCIVIVSSAYDLLNHQSYRFLAVSKIMRNEVELFHRIPTSTLHLPLNDAFVKIDSQIFEELSHKSFLQPDKIAELYSPLIPQFWQQVANELHVDLKDLKAKVKAHGVWRNRIVHESDINPDLSGISIWPIVKTDVESAIEFYHQLGTATVLIVSRS